MNLIRLLIGAICLLLLSPIGFSQQRNCGTMEHLEMQESIDPKVGEKLDRIERHTQAVLANPHRAVNGTVTIPVVFHVVYQSSAQNISDAQIQSQLTVLNDDFRRNNSDADGTWSQAADTEIEFCMASVDPSGNPTNGITRTSTSVNSFGTNDAVKSSSSGGVNAWPASDYLNIWVCNIGGGILGYAQFPGGNPATDGVVNDYRYTGTIGTATAPFDLGRTLTHEVGHYLNLRHIWGDGNCNADDFVSDTPTSDAANYGCATGHVSCSSTDMVQNYMDYSDDACMNLFTAGQKARMRAIFDTGGARASLLNSNGCGTGTPATCDDGIQNQGETGVDCGGPCAPCVCNGTEVTVTIILDNYPEETSWTITSGGTTFASGGTYGSQPDGSTVVIIECLPDDCYDFRINDAYGDGICCGYGNGSYSVTGGGSTLASGGNFGASETTNFCLSSAPPVLGCTDPSAHNYNEDATQDDGSCLTCSDGLQNGDETGEDCGGSCAACPPDPVLGCTDSGAHNYNPVATQDNGSCETCSDNELNGDETDVDCGGTLCDACPTCSDDIQNQGETGIDCGGPCTACAILGCTDPNAHNYNSNATQDDGSCETCSDGIANGDETGIDCGGSCPNTCGGGGCSYVTINSQDFESGWALWNDGGSDCRRSYNDRAYAYSGNYCARLRDNTSSSTTTTDNLNLTGYEEITVEFFFYARSMENNEDFWLQISTNGGSSYTTVASWARGSSFNNNTFYTTSVVIPGPFTSNTRVRFRNDASSNSDWVYIDDVTITGCASNTREIDPEASVTSENSRINPEGIHDLTVLSNLEVYPNPTVDRITVSYDLKNDATIQLMITDFAGRTLQSQVMDQSAGNQQTELDVGQLNAGFYFVQMITKDSRQTKKFVVVR